MTRQTGLDRWVEEDFKSISGRKFGLVCNAATVDSGLVHAIDRMKPHGLGAIFGPQHGLWGHTQDNMIEWNSNISAPIPLHSLYGEQREPTDEMLTALDALVVDLPDIGSRYYTFIWTMAHCMKACEKQDLELFVLDRPNPISNQVEGMNLDPEFASFVGLHPLLNRHGKTLGELALYFKREFYPKLNLTVIESRGFESSQYLDEACLPWVMPSPNMPTLDTAMVYPGMCLLEGTNISEGRGTTRPFETFGAPFIDGFSLSSDLNSQELPGVFFRPVEFQPTFQKHMGELCGGCFIHVLDRREFKPVLTATAILKEIVEKHGEAFEWKKPPYEYEFDKLPIDILAGNDWFRKMLESGSPLSDFKERFRADESLASHN